MIRLCCVTSWPVLYAEIPIEPGRSEVGRDILSREARAVRIRSECDPGPRMGHDPPPRLLVLDRLVDDERGAGGRKGFDGYHRARSSRDFELH